MAKGVFHVLMAIMVAMSLVALASGWGSTAEHAKERAGEASNAAKAKAEEVKAKAEEKAKSWAGWARDKASQGFEFGKDKGGDVAGKTKDAFNNAASGAQEKAHEMGRKLVEKDKVVESAPKAYEDAKHKVGEAYETAKNTMTHKAKSNDEAEKEKLSHATDQVGATMGTAEEL